MQNIFGAGSLWGIRTDNTTGVSTPVKFGVLQEVQFDFTRTIKELFGGYQMPIAIGAGTMKPTAKAKNARIFIDQYAELFFGLSSAAGQSLISEDEAGTIPAAGGPYTISVTDAATWTDDLGVFFTATGLPLKKVATGATPAKGQYKVASGIYTFAAADAGLAVLINYAYTMAATLNAVQTTYIPATPYQVTVDHATDFVANVSVKNLATGVSLTDDSPSSPTLAGHYKVANGLYTFVSDDEDLAIQIEYTYTGQSGRKLTLTNQLLGVTPTFQGWFKGNYRGKQCVLKLANCVSSKLTLPTKLEDFSIQEFDFSMFADDSNNIGILSASE